MGPRAEVYPHGHTLSLPAPDMIQGSHQMHQNLTPRVVKAASLIKHSSLLSIHKHPFLLYRHNFSHHPSVPFMAFLSTSHPLHRILLFNHIIKISDIVRLLLQLKNLQRISLESTINIVFI